MAALKENEQGIDLTTPEQYWRAQALTSFWHLCYIDHRNVFWVPETYSKIIFPWVNGLTTENWKPDCGQYVETRPLEGCPTSFYHPSCYTLKTLLGGGMRVILPGIDLGARKLQCAFCEKLIG